jgi:hypothetical protein
VPHKGHLKEKNRRDIVSILEERSLNNPRKLKQKKEREKMIIRGLERKEIALEAKEFECFITV